jgi:hypothetical protein
VAQNRYFIGKIDITNLNIALREKDDARRSYLQALKSFWTAYSDRADSRSMTLRIKGCCMFQEAAETGNEMHSTVELFG